MGVFGSSFGIGFIVSFAAIPWILAASNWRMGAVFTGIFTLAVTIPCWAVFGKLRIVNPTEKMDPTGSTFKGLFSKSLVYSILINFTGLSVYLGITTWAPLYLTHSLNISLVEVGFMMAALGVMMIISSFAGGVLTPKVGGGRVVIISMAMCVVLPIVLIFTPSVWAGVLIMAAVGWAAGFYVPPVFARVSSASREHSGVDFGVFNMATLMGYSITPIIVGYILDTTGRYDIGFLTLSIIAILGLIGALLFGQRNPPHQ
jgi:predicted MFS family arabinose efflux permease